MADETTTSSRSVPGNPFATGRALGQAIADHATQFHNVTPFRWGGTDPHSGVDDAGLIQAVYGHFGFQMPRTSHGQAQMGPEVPIEQAHPGDLIHWINSPDTPSASHVGIYVGDGQVLHAPRPGRVVRAEPIFDPEHAQAIRVIPHN